MRSDWQECNELVTLWRGGEEHRWQRIGWRQTQSHFFRMTVLSVPHANDAGVIDSQLSCKVDSHIYTSGERKPEEETHLQPFHLETRAVWGKRRPSATARSKFRPAPEEPPPPTRSDSQIQASHRFMGWKNKGERQRGERKSENNGRNPQRKRQTERWEAHSCGSWKILDHTLKKQQMTDAKLFLEKRINKERVIFRNITVTDTSKESETSSRLWSKHHVLFQQARVY